MIFGALGAHFGRLFVLLGPGADRIFSFSAVQREVRERKRIFFENPVPVYTGALLLRSGGLKIEKKSTEKEGQVSGCPAHFWCLGAPRHPRRL